VRRTLLFAARSAAVLIAIELAFSLLSPTVFGVGASWYGERIQSHYPRGSSADSALKTLIADGLPFDTAMRPCSHIGDACRKYYAAPVYAGGNPLCSYWNGIGLVTAQYGKPSEQRFRKRVIDSWYSFRGPVSCFWQKSAFRFGVPVVIETARAELTLR